MRLKSEIWVKSYLRHCAGQGLAAVVVRHGDDDAGAIYVKINRLDGTARLFAPAAAGLSSLDGERQWSECLSAEGVPEAEVDARLRREIEFDSDLWVIEVEARDGRHLLDGWLAP